MMVVSRVANREAERLAKPKSAIYKRSSPGRAMCFRKRATASLSPILFRHRHHNQYAATALTGLARCRSAVQTGGASVRSTLHTFPGCVDPAARSTRVQTGFPELATQRDRYSVYIAPLHSEGPGQVLISRMVGRSSE